MTDAAASALRRLVGVEPVDDDRAIGSTNDGGRGALGIFGGQMIAQCVSAGVHTVPPDAVPDSVHANLLSGGTSGEPIEFRIERVRDGRTLRHRDVRGYQGGTIVVHATVAWTLPSEGIDWQRPTMPEVAPPEPAADAPSAWGGHLGAGVFEIAHPAGAEGDPPPIHPIWVRAIEPVPDVAWLHAASVAYWSDFGMNRTTREMHHQLDPRPVFSLSAHHSLWFHRPTRADAWHLFDPHPQSLAGNQGFVQAGIFDTAGRLVASAVQGVYVRTDGTRLQPRGPLPPLP